VVKFIVSNLRENDENDKDAQFVRSLTYLTRLHNQIGITPHQY
jgi:hypothetical protein